MAGDRTTASDKDSLTDELSIFRQRRTDVPKQTKGNFTGFGTAWEDAGSSRVGQTAPHSVLTKPSAKMSRSVRLATGRTFTWTRPKTTVAYEGEKPHGNYGDKKQHMRLLCSFARAPVFAFAPPVASLQTVKANVTECSGGKWFYSDFIFIGGLKTQ
ncbi:Hypothetical protein SMAX5B_009010 [Scophthalmus maximus]|uniref:Uncharacterized protein n=1 Tax=Scophthalmus maximus TaxID=52904 RepID=A0A2U9CK51_SCOMX|nr:Hypothetical protein SMAX5B_009010 [Scophthalmus maximus]